MTFSTPTTDRFAASPDGRRGGRGPRIFPGVVTIVLLAGGAAVWGWWNGSLGGLPIRPHCTATALGSTAELDPEQAGNAAIIAGIAMRRGLPARAATIGIATARQESKLINVSGGDRDSVGLFQQRPSQGWGTAEQVHDPVYATNAFYDVLVKIEGYQNLPITKAAQQVQRSAFPAAYADHEPGARIWASALAGHSPAALNCVLAQAQDTGRRDARGDDGLVDRARAVQAAARQELGRNAVPQGSDGRVLRFGAAGSEPVRVAWSVAQWAVARADGLDVVAVEAEGKQWRRGESTKGWTPLRDGPATGQVVVRVA
jgi:hypothetical protein